MRRSAFLLFTLLTAAHGQSLFEDHADIGTVLHTGAIAFDASQGTYTITASGENVWGTADAFHFTWKKFSGDADLTADITFPTKTGNPHKKAMLMIRQSLDADSAYVDAALHVEGLTSLQFRSEKGGATHEVGIASASPSRLRLEKRGPYFYMYLAKPGEPLHLGGGSTKLVFTEPFYIGLGVSAHDKDAVETAVFSNVSIEPPAKGKAKLHSTLETISVSSTDRRVVAVFDQKIEDPTWTPDGNFLTFKEGGHLKKIPAAGGTVEDVPGNRKMRDSGLEDVPGKVSYWTHEQDGTTTLSVKTTSDGKVKILAKLFEGPQPNGTPSFSPDGKRITFVSYQMVPSK
jgi:hypothetical protein